MFFPLRSKRDFAAVESRPTFSLVLNLAKKTACKNPARHSHHSFQNIFYIPLEKLTSFYLVEVKTSKFFIGAGSSSFLLSAKEIPERFFGISRRRLESGSLSFFNLDGKGSIEDNGLRVSSHGASIVWFVVAGNSIVWFVVASKSNSLRSWHRLLAGIFQVLFISHG